MHVIERMILTESSVAFTGMVLNPLWEGKLKNWAHFMGFQEVQNSPFTTIQVQRNSFLLPREKYNIWHDF